MIFVSIFCVITYFYLHEIFCFYMLLYYYMSLNEIIVKILLCDY